MKVGARVRVLDAVPFEPYDGDYQGRHGVIVGFRRALRAGCIYGDLAIVRFSNGDHALFYDCEFVEVPS